MKFSIQRPAFIKALNDVARAISSKNTLEILSGMKIILTNDGLTLTGSNNDVSIETMISIGDKAAELTIASTGGVVVPARFFIEVVKKLPEEMVTFELKDRSVVELSSGKASFTLNGTDPEGYPQLPAIDSSTQLTLSGDILTQLINQTVIAVSKQETRPILTGVHMQLTDGTMLAVATDSHRLAQRKMHLSTPAKDFDIIVPGKSLQELTKMISDSQDDVEIQVTENRILFIMGNTSFYSRLLEGMYPDTQQLIPKTSETTIELAAKPLLAAIERASLLSHEGRTNIVNLTLSSENQTAVLSSDSPEVGNVEEAIAFNQLTGGEISIAFNPDYMKDALRSFGQADIKLQFTQPLRPFVLVPSDADDEFVQLITPVRTY